MNIASNFILNWSGGKDSTMALYTLKKANKTPRMLLTTVGPNGRISMHGVSGDLLHAQAHALGITLFTISLPASCPMPEYNAIMTKAWAQLKEDGIDQSVFGDIFLEDLRAYRDGVSAQLGLVNHYPLWQKNTRELMQEFIELGFKAKVVCVDAKKLPKSFVGRELNESFLADLPKGIDPCGENGEFHSFVYDGPLFKKAIPLDLQDIVHKRYKKQEEDKECFMNDGEDLQDGFWYADYKLNS